MNVAAKLPGLIATLLIAIAAYALQQLPFSPFTVHLASGQIVHPLEAMVLAILLGILVENVFIRGQAKSVSTETNLGYRQSPNLSERLATGINFSVKSLLPLAIILMGVKFDLLTVFKISAHALVLNVFCVVLAYFVTIYLCKLFRVDSKLSALIAIGTAICGGSAIVVLSPMIKASRTQTSIAITIISLFGLVAIFLYPYLGHLFGLNQTAFGIWAGTAIQAVPQVVAAGFAFGVIAGQVGTIVKMVRILLLAPMVVLLGAKEHKSAGESVDKKKWHQFLPSFILFFVGMVVLNTVGVFTWLDHLVPHFSVSHVALQVSGFLMTMAMAGVGLNTDLGHMLKSGTKPLMAGLAAALVMAGISLAAVLIFFNT